MEGLVSPGRAGGNSRESAGRRVDTQESLPLGPGVLSVPKDNAGNKGEHRR